jgi:glucose/arabinose dehydrogenase
MSNRVQLRGLSARGQRRICAHVGRPTGLVVAKDGSLLMSDDANGVIHRLSYAGAQ